MGGCPSSCKDSSSAKQFARQGISCNYYAYEEEQEDRLMADLNLQPNESVVMKSDHVRYITSSGFMSPYVDKYTNELILTNLNIILVNKSQFGKTKGVQYYPLNQIKVFDGKASALLSKQRSGLPQLEIYFMQGQEAFGFESKQEVLKWVSNINQLLVGKVVGIDDSDDMTLPGTAQIVEPLKATIDAFKGAFSLKSETKQEVSQEVVTGKCTACSAPISGVKGQAVKCQYCGSDQQL